MLFYTRKQLLLGRNKEHNLYASIATAALAKLVFVVPIVTFHSVRKSVLR